MGIKGSFTKINPNRTKCVTGLGASLNKVGNCCATAFVVFKNQFLHSCVFAGYAYYSTALAKQAYISQWKNGVFKDSS